MADMYCQSRERYSASMKDYLLGRIDDFPEGKGRAFKAGTRTVAVFRPVRSWSATAGE